MCGIIGAVLRLPDIESQNILEELMFESRIRGMHSYGTSVQVHGENNIETTITKDQTTIYQKWGKNIGKPFITIGHCRYSTSGEHGQPIHVVPHTSLVFNGNIHMGTKDELEEYFGLKLTTDNDGEVFVRRFLNITLLQDIIDFINLDNISFAGMFLHANCLFVLRNEKRPLYTAFYSGNTYFASTYDIFKKVGLNQATMIPANKIKVISIL